MTLYEIGADLKNFMEALEAGEIPEEAIADTLDALQGEFDAKADRVACAIKNQEAEAQAIKGEIKELEKRAKAKERSALWLKEYLLCEMQAIGKNKLETPRNIIRVGKNPTSVKIEDDAKFVLWAAQHNDRLLTYSAPKPNKKAIREFLEAGEELPGAELVRGVRIAIK